MLWKSKGDIAKDDDSRHFFAFVCYMIYVQLFNLFEWDIQTLYYFFKNSKCSKCVHYIISVRLGWTPKHEREVVVLVVLNIFPFYLIHAFINKFILDVKKYLRLPVFYFPWKPDQMALSVLKVADPWSTVSQLAELDSKLAAELVAENSQT